MMRPLAALLLIAALVGMGARRLKLPYTLALVLAGLALGFVHLPALDGLALTPELLLLLFLPPLLFEAAFTSLASSATNSGSMPNCWLPISTSPDSFSRMRL